MRNIHRRPITREHVRPRPGLRAPVRARERACLRVEPTTDLRELHVGRSKEIERILERAQAILDATKELRTLGFRQGLGNGPWTVTVPTLTTAEWHTLYEHVFSPRDLPTGGSRT